MVEQLSGTSGIMSRESTPVAPPAVSQPEPTAPRPPQSLAELAAQATAQKDPKASSPSPEDTVGQAASGGPDATKKQEGEQPPADMAQAGTSDRQAAQEDQAKAEQARPGAERAARAIIDEKLAEIRAKVKSGRLNPRDANSMDNDTYNLYYYGLIRDTEYPVGSYKVDAADGQPEQPGKQVIAPDLQATISLDGGTTAAVNIAWLTGGEMGADGKRVYTCIGIDPAEPAKQITGKITHEAFVTAYLARASASIGSLFPENSTDRQLATWHTGGGQATLSNEAVNAAEYENSPLGMTERALRTRETALEEEIRGLEGKKKKEAQARLSRLKFALEARGEAGVIVKDGVLRDLAEEEKSDELSQLAKKLEPETETARNKLINNLVDQEMKRSDAEKLVAKLAEGPVEVAKFLKTLNEDLLPDITTAIFGKKMSEDEVLTKFGEILGTHLEPDQVEKVMKWAGGHKKGILLVLLGLILAPAAALAIAAYAGEEAALSGLVGAFGGNQR